MNKETYSLSLETLTIFRNLLNDRILSRLNAFFQIDDKNTKECVSKYCDFVSELYKVDTNLSNYIYQLVMNDENVVVTTIGKKKSLSLPLQQALDYELEVIEQISNITSEQIIKGLDIDGFLPQWENTSYDYKKEYQTRLDQIGKKGYGIYAKHRAFCIKKHQVVPILNPDPQRLSDLVGYQEERNKVIKNTLAFLQGLDSHNVLLYGDAGTGKSSTIKAIVNEYYDQGLRLIEVKKHQLHQIPNLMDQLADNPLHFILFIDDLSFESNDDNFIALKTILEGGIQHAANNIAVYATTNRRHFVKENMEQRAGTEVFRNDVIQETISLASRFGLTVTFQKPKKDLYNEIVLELAKRRNLQLDEKELLIRAHAYAIRSTGFSPRTAKQFIELEKINEVMEGNQDV